MFRPWKLFSAVEVEKIAVYGMKGKRFQLFAKKINNNESQISTAFIHFCMLKNKRDEML